MRKQGTILLEVIFALALFVMAAGVIMGGLSSSISAVRRMKLESQASDLAVTTLSQIQLGIINPTDTPATPFDDPSLDGWTYAVNTAPPQGMTPPPGVLTLEIVIVNTDKNYTYRLSQFLPDPAFQPTTQPGGGQ